MSELDRKELYDDIVFDYMAIKSNIFKTRHEGPAFWNALGNVIGHDVLDLASGSGYYTRKIKQHGASKVVGVDISKEMIAEAKEGESSCPLDIEYHVADAAKYVHGHGFDIVTAQYLFCYADSKEKLLSFCNTAFKNTKPGGRLVTVSTVLDEKCQQENKSLGFKFVPSVGTDSDTRLLYDGVKVNVSLYSEDFKSHCTFPNYLWSFETIRSQLNACGFTSVQGQPVLSGFPIMIIIARREG